MRHDSLLNNREAESGITLPRNLPKIKDIFSTKIVLTLEATLIQNKEREWTIPFLQRRFLLTPKIRQPD
jgi:hypothetical protein